MKIFERFKNKKMNAEEMKSVKGGTDHRYNCLVNAVWGCSNNGLDNSTDFGECIDNLAAECDRVFPK